METIIGRMQHELYYLPEDLKAKCEVLTDKGMLVFKSLKDFLKTFNIPKHTYKVTQDKTNTFWVWQKKDGELWEKVDQWCFKTKAKAFNLIYWHKLNYVWSIGFGGSKGPEEVFIKLVKRDWMFVHLANSVKRTLREKNLSEIKISNSGLVRNPDAENQIPDRFTLDEEGKVILWFTDGDGYELYQLEDGFILELLKIVNIYQKGQ